MSLQLPTILPPPTPCIPFPTLTVSPWVDVTLLPFSLPGQLSVFWASPFPSRLTNASGRIEFIIFLIMDWLFASGCSPPRLSATQLPSATDSQCSVRRGLSPRCWCALSGALGPHLRGGVLGGLLGDLPLPQSCLALPARRTWIPTTPLVIFLLMKVTTIDNHLIQLTQYGAVNCYLIREG